MGTYVATPKTIDSKWHVIDAGGQVLGRVATLANSAHSGGVNVVLCDGSVRFITNTISLQTWRSLGSRNLGEVLNLP